MGERSNLNEAEIWTEWEKTDPEQDAVNAMRAFFDHLDAQQSAKGTERITSDDLRQIMAQVATEHGLTPPNCDRVWDERPRRWVLEQDVTQLIDFCAIYSLNADSKSSDSISASEHEEYLSRTVEKWRNKTHLQTRTKAFIDTLLAQPAERRGETFATNLKEFLAKSGKKTLQCRELQLHLEALYKQSKGQPVGE